MHVSLLLLPLRVRSLDFHFFFLLVRSKTIKKKQFFLRSYRGTHIIDRRISPTSFHGWSRFLWQSRKMEIWCGEILIFWLRIDSKFLNSINGNITTSLMLTSHSPSKKKTRIETQRWSSFSFLRINPSLGECSIFSSCWKLLYSFQWAAALQNDVWDLS